MQSRSRTYQRGGRECRYRYFAAIPMKTRRAWMKSTPYVDAGAARRKLRQISGAYPASVLMRSREWLGDGKVLQREYEIERNGRWQINDNR